MSILNVSHLSHGFGDRMIYHDVTFRLLKGEHIGLIGANGEGKSTFFNIILGNLLENAIEASVNSIEKKLKLEINYQKGILLICIQNTYHGTLEIDDSNQIFKIRIMMYL